MPATLASLFVYPLKAARGLAVAAWDVDRFGLRLDRSFMVVDAESGLFVSQREEPRLALLQPSLAHDSLRLEAPGCGALRLPLAAGTGPLRRVRIWGHEGDALDLGDEAAKWLEGVLGRPLRLVRLAPDHARPVNPERSPLPAVTSFTDGYPLLVVSEASLRELNRRLASPLPMERFRPNLVVAGTEPHAEDGWRRLRIGGLELAIVKPCDRCVVTTVDPATGERRGPEPLATLARYRRAGGQVLFGQNAVHLGTGRLAVGTPVEVLEGQEPPRFD
jgi:uncharacterized protein YcbX